MLTLRLQEHFEGKVRGPSLAVYWQRQRYSDSCEKNIKKYIKNSQTISDVFCDLVILKLDMLEKRKRGIL